MAVCAWNRWPPSPRFFANTTNQFERNCWGQSCLPSQRNCWAQPIRTPRHSFRKRTDWLTRRLIRLRLSLLPPRRATSHPWPRPRQAAASHPLAALRLLPAGANPLPVVLPRLQVAILPLGRREADRDIAVTESFGDLGNSLGSLRRNETAMALYTREAHGVFAMPLYTSRRCSTLTAR